MINIDYTINMPYFYVHFAEGGCAFALFYNDFVDKLNMSGLADNV